MKRLYSIRFTRSYWSIPLVSRHICSAATCSKILHVVNDSVIAINNPNYKNGKCNRSIYLYPTVVHLDTICDSESSQGMLGELENINDIVIPDKDFDIQFDFPLNKPARLRVSTDGNTTLDQLLKIIRDKYRSVYEREEETCSYTNFTLSKKCSCLSKDINEYVQSIAYPTEGTCSICLTDFSEKQCIQLHCNHIFHQDCFSGWTDQNKHSCPLCRSGIRMCFVCNNSGEIRYTQSYKILPRHLRDDGFRNTTDGEFEIYDFDFDQLVLERMIYNRHERLLVLQMDSLQV